VLKTQLEVACKLYNALLHAEQEEYEENKRTMSMNELRQLALDLRKQNKEFQALHSQVAQQVADRFYGARQRFFEGLRTSRRKRSLTATFPWCTLRVAGGFLTRGKLDEAKTKRRGRLGSVSKIGFFTLILHREFPESQVSQVCVKLYPSGRIHVIFLVEEPEAQEEQPSEGGAQERCGC